MNAETKDTALEAIGLHHDLLLLQARDRTLDKWDRDLIAKSLRRCRRALRDLRRSPINLGGIDCE